MNTGCLGLVMFAEIRAASVPFRPPASVQTGPLGCARGVGGACRLLPIAIARPCRRVCRIRVRLPHHPYGVSDDQSGSRGGLDCGPTEQRRSSPLGRTEVPPMHSRGRRRHLAPAQKAKTARRSRMVSKGRASQDEARPAANGPPPSTSAMDCEYWDQIQGVFATGLIL